MLFSTLLHKAKPDPGIPRRTWGFAKLLRSTALALLFLCWEQPSWAQQLDCDSGGDITITATNPKVEKNNEFTPNGANNVEQYQFLSGGGTGVPRSGPELVYRINWSGGDFRAAIDITGGANLDMFLTATCDPNTIFNWATSNDAQEQIFESDLAAGSYYLIVDGKSGDEGLFDLTVEIDQPPLDCNNAITIDHLVKYEGNFSNAVNNFTDYGNRGENLTGREVLVKIDLPETIWLAGQVFFDLGGDAEKLIFLNSCDPNDVFAGPLIDPGTAQLLTGAGTQTYYAIIEGPSNGGDGNFELTIRRDHLDCNDERPITVGQATDPNSIKFAPYTYVNNYCGDPNSTKLELQEAIYKLSGWPGGNLKATMSDMIRSGGSWDDAALVLLRDCADPASCVAGPVINDGESELVLNASDLPAGDYFIIVDGVTASGINPTFELLIEEDARCLNISQATLECGQIDQWRLDPDGGSEIDAHGSESGFIGPEEAYRIKWDGGRLNASFQLKQPGMGLFLYDDCASGNPLASGETDLQADLAAGTYFVVVDSRDATGGKYDFFIQNLDSPCLLPDFLGESVSTSSCVNPGQTIAIDFTVGNAGTRKATDEEVARTEDRFYLAQTTSTSEAVASGTLLGTVETISPEPGQEIQRSISLQIPGSVAAGDYNLFYIADFIPNAVEEIFLAAGNNSTFTSISIGNSGADYLPTDLAGPSAAAAGQDIEMTLTIKNEGTAAGQGNGGFDKYYISQNSSLDGTEILLTPSASTPTGTADIQPGQSFDVRGTVTIPAETAPGNYYILFHHDADNKVAECNEANNVDAHPITIRNGVADYVPLDFKLDGQTSLTVAQGQRVSGSLLAKNIGSTAGLVHTDGKYYYSQDDQFDPSTDLYLGESNDIEPLSPGQGTNEFENIKIPSDAALGTGYIFYWLDAEERIAESNEENNIVFVTLNITSAPTTSGVASSFTVDNANPCKDTEVQFTATTTGTNVVLDQSPKENDGTLNNFASNPTVNSSSNDLGKALEFDGNDDVLSLPNTLLAGESSLTFEARILYDGGVRNRRIFDANAGDRQFIALVAYRDDPAKPGFTIKKGPGNGASERVDLNASSSLNIGQWNHVAVVIDGDANIGRFYVNGNLEDEKPLPFGLEELTSINKVSVGGGSAFGDGEQLEGNMDEVRFWNIARNTSDIQANQNRPLTGREFGLLAYYNFDQALSGSTPSYSWSFPGGSPTSSNAANPTVSYPASSSGQSFDVSLTTTIGSSSSIESKSDFITVKNCAEPGQLDAEYSFSPSEPCEDEEVQFANNTQGLTFPGPNELPDNTANRNTGELQNFLDPYSPNGDFGDALSFNNTNNYVDCGNFLPVSYTKEAWIKPNDSAGNIISGDGGTNNHAMYLGGYRMRVWQNGSGDKILDPDAVEPNVWVHFAVTYDAATQRLILYKNGQLVGEASDVTPGGVNAKVLLGGYGSTPGGNFLFGGQMDEVRIWNGARSAAEILANYNKPLTGAEAGLLAYYNCNAGAGASYSWTFENGSPATSSLENPAVSFPGPGTYDVQLTATQNGVSNSTFGSVTVKDCNSTCDFQLTDRITINAGNPVEEYLGISNASGTNNIESYTLQDGTVLDGYNSPELIYELNWPGGDFEAFLNIPQGSSRIGVFLLRDCDPASVAYTSISNVGSTTVRKIAIQDLASGTYYLIVDSRFGETKNFDLRVSNTGLDCGSGGQITIDSNNPSVVLTNQSTTNDGVNNIDSYGLITNLAGVTYLVRTGPELVYQLNWPGGELRASIDIQGSTSLDLILLQECLSTTVLAQVNGSGLQQITTDLEQGTYYLVVDGFQGRSGDYTLTVSGASNGGEPDWPVVETGDNHTVIVQSSVVVDIDGMGLSTGDYIGAFYMDGAVERCGGKIRWEGENVSISVFGDDTGTGAKDGFSAGETFKWRVWKASSQQEFEVDVTYQPLGGIFTHQGNYSTNGISGWATAIYDPIQEQTISLQPGWNMISSYIDATDASMTDIFDAIKGSIALVKDETGKSYIPSFNINGIGDWLVEEGYQVKVNGNAALDLKIEGIQVDPANTPLNLRQGWNIMAYLRDVPQDVVDALTPIRNNTILVKNGSGQTYVPSFNINAIGDMLPGQGYQIKLSDDATLTYNANARVGGPFAQNRSEKDASRQIMSLQPDWPVVQTGDNHTIIIEGSIASDFDGASLQPGDYVGVFYDVEGTLVCGGKAEWTGENIAMSAFGDDSGSADKDGFAANETFVWKVWRASDGKEFDAMAEYSPTGAVISHTDMFTINGISGISSLTEATSTSISSFREAGIKLFPNPSNGKFWIELPDFAKAEVKVFNYTGQLVRETTFQGETRKQVDLSNQPQGMYVVHVEQAGKVAVSKVQINR